MKKIAVVATVIAIISAPVFAASTEGGFSGPVSTSPVSQVQERTGGFNDANARVSGAADLDKMNDGARVKLRGNIVERLSGDHYLHPDCDTLVCFVYGPDGWVNNPKGVIGDLEEGDAEGKTKVVIAQF